jgi:hypothetical protein
MRRSSYSCHENALVGERCSYGQESFLIRHGPPFIGGLRGGSVSLSCPSGSPCRTRELLV